MEESEFQSKSQISINNDFNIQCNNFKQYNSKLKDNHKILVKTIESYTVQEQLEVNKAINKLNQKIQIIMDNKKMKEFQNINNELQKTMYTSLQKVVVIFEKFRKKTIERKDLTSDEKMKIIKMAFEKLQKKLFTEAEISEFKNQFKNIVMTVPKRSSYRNIRKAIEN